jgi:hypothetical protein
MNYTQQAARYQITEQFNKKFVIPHLPALDFDWGMRNPGFPV